MPFYEYRCGQCGNLETFFFRSFADVKEPSCAACGSQTMSRLISRSTVVRSTTRRAAETDPERYLRGFDTRDRSSVVRWAHQMADEFGDTLGSEFHELAEQAEAGTDALPLLDGEAMVRSKLTRAAQGDEKPLTKFEEAV